MEFSRAEQNGAGVRALFADGTEIEADLLIGADGVHSTVRGQYWSDSKPAYAGYIAWRHGGRGKCFTGNTCVAVFALCILPAAR